jgi:hypothetical protein
MRFWFGGSIMVRQSWYYRGPHFMWKSPDGHVILDFVPIKKKVRADGRKRRLPRPVFRGRIRAIVIGKEILHGKEDAQRDS